MGFLDKIVGGGGDLFGGAGESLFGGNIIEGLFGLRWRNEGKLLTAFVGYRSLPSGSTIKFYQKANWASSWTEITTRVDSAKAIVVTDDFTPAANVIQIKCELNPNGNNAPEVDVIELGFN